MTSYSTELTRLQQSEFKWQYRDTWPNCHSKVEPSHRPPVYHQFEKFYTVYVVFYIILFGDTKFPKVLRLPYDHLLHLISYVCRRSLLP